MPKQGWWHRIGTFYELKQTVSSADWTRRLQCPVQIHGVSFRNSMPSEVILRQIYVMQYTDGSARIDLKASPFKFDELIKAYNFIFKTNYTIEDSLSQTLKLEFTAETGLKLIELFNYLNTKSQSEEFSPELMAEIIQLSASLKMNRDLFYTQKHKISEGTVSTAHVNPSREKSKDLVNLLQYAPVNKQSELEKDLKKLLTKGEDPNQESGLGQTPLSLAVLGCDKLILMLLLCYGANPWAPTNDFSGFAPIELAKLYNDNEKFTFIEKACAQVEKPTSVSRSLSSVKTIDTFANANKVTTIIELADSKTTLVSTLKEISELTEEETSQLLDLYTHIFHTSTEDIKKGFDQAFSPAPGKWIDIIRDKTGRIIGAATYILRKETNDLYLMVDLSFLHPDYQGCGIMPLIDYRVAFALQKLFPNFNTYVVFLAASYAAFRRVEHLLCTPKYQPEGIKDRLKHVFADLFHYSLTWNDTPDGVYFNVKEENQLVSTNKQTKSNAPIMEEFFHQHLRGAMDGYIPVLIPVRDDLLAALQNMLSPRQINFNDQCQFLAKALEKSTLLDDSMNAKGHGLKNNKAISSKYLFWNNQQVPSEKGALSVQLAVPLSKSQYNSHY